MKKRFARLCALALALLLLLTLLPAPARAGAGEVRVSSVEELLELAKNCALDAWSVGRIVRLTADLDLTGTDFAPIPSFSGCFEGGGHVIRGLELTAPGSVQGFFRYLEAEALVRDLHLEGAVAPSGSRVSVGGLAGSNAGRVVSCSFAGRVAGAVNTGGLVGENLSTGTLEDCVFSGEVSGQTRCGGLTGVNRGVIRSCRNEGTVNAGPADASSLNELADAGLEGAIGLLSGTAEGTASLPGLRTDAGGVAGASSGTIMNCVNAGDVGYPHTGYNVGGIAGRQSGLIRACRNEGRVLGRKDVGGIVGQAEPAILVTLREEDGVSLRRELSTLSELIDRAASGADAGSVTLSADLAAIGSQADLARNSASSLVLAGEELLRDNLALLDGLVGSLSAASAELPAGFDALNEASAALGRASEDLGEAFGALGSVFEETDPAWTGLSEAVGGFSETEEALQTALSSARGAMELLEGAVAARNEDTAALALSELADAASAAAVSTLRIRELLRQLAGLPWERESLEKLRESLTAVADELEKLAGAASRCREAALTLQAQLRFDPALFWASLQQFSGALAELNEAGAAARRSFDRLSTAFREAGGATAALDGVTTALGDFSASLGEAVSALPAAFRAFSGAAQALGTAPSFRLGSDEALAAQESLFTALSGVSAGLSSLNRDAASLGRELAEDLSAVNRQLNLVLTLLLDAVDEAREDVEELDLTSLLEDTSDEDVVGARTGKLAACVNRGPVEGDRSVGGLAGSMAIELALDPEDDSPLQLRTGASYQTKAILLDCVNHGAVLCKKDCVGGLCGRMELGTILGSENYGDVASTGGDFAGGAAGLAEGRIRGCFVKCAVSGGSHVGGVAGSGAVIRSCVALVRLQGGGEYLGAIAGQADVRSGGVTDNVYLDLGVAAVDSFSYAGLAEGVSYAALAGREDLPADFLSFTLTLRAEGETVAELPFSFGEDLSALALPAPPEKEGRYGRWPALTAEDAVSDLTVEAVYARRVTLLASRGVTDRGFPLAFAEGSFTDAAVLTTEEPDLATPAPAEGMQGWRAVDYSLTGEAAALPLTLRLRCEQTPDRVLLRLPQPRGGEDWKELSAFRRGSYLCLTVPEASGRLLLLYEKRQMPLPLPILAGGAVLLAALLLWLLLRRRKKRRAAAKAGAAEKR